MGSQLEPNETSISLKRKVHIPITIKVERCREVKGDGFAEII